MMIKVEQVQDLLNADDEQLKKIETEQLRTILGSFRFLVRRMEREINSRTSETFMNGTENRS